MFSKIAISNVKKSFKDYSIYFLTLTFAVCIFYIFNSIDAQQATLEMNRSTKESMKDMKNIISIVSVFVSFVLGGLIIYANNFLIKKRKKELGIYMTLGMGKMKISRILILETFFIGLLSLVAGILLGIVVSQGLSVVTAKLLSVTMSKYKFIISTSAIAKSALYFGLIFLFVMMFNQITISRYKLIDMLNASKKNEDIKVKNPIISMALLIISIICLGVAYKLILKVGLHPLENGFLTSIILGIAGTLLCFFSLSSFLMYIIQKNKKMYFKGLNIFVLRQINNKVTTNFISMSVICLMLLISITVLFPMFSYTANTEKSLEGNISFDASGEILVSNREARIASKGKNEDFKKYFEKELLNKYNFKFDDSEKYVMYTINNINLSLKDILNKYLNNTEKKDGKINNAINTLKISDYNSIKQLEGKQSVTLKSDEILIVSNYDEKSALCKFMKNEHSITIDGKVYKIKNETPVKENICTGSFDSYFYIILPDDFGGEFVSQSKAFNVMFKGTDPKKSEQKFEELFKYNEKDYMLQANIQVGGKTREQYRSNLYGSGATTVFLSIYLGMVFLISSAAVLALQQLSEASDSLDRYKSLKKIGATEKMINRSMFIQNFIYFMAPLTLAIIHSIVSVQVILNDSRSKTTLEWSTSLIITLVFFIIYGGYFYTTYVGYKNVVKNSN